METMGRVAALTAAALLTVFGAPAGAGVSPAHASLAARPGTHVAVGSVPTQVPGVPGSFVAVTPAVLLDTRTGVGAPRAAVAPGGLVELQVAGRAGVPSQDVSAVALDLNVIAPGATGELAAYPTGQGAPSTDILPFTAGSSRAHADVAALGTGGKIDLVNRSTGTIELAAEVSGYYVAGEPTAPGAFVPLPAARVFDTGAGIGAPKAPVAGGTQVTVTVGGHGGVPGTGVSAVVLNVAASSTGSGYLTVAAVFAAAPETLPFSPGQVSSNLVVVPVDADGRLAVTNFSSAAVNVAADVYGYYLGGTPTSAGLFGAVRALAVPANSGRSVAPGTAAVFQVAGTAGAPSPGLRAVVLNIVASNPSAAGALTVYAHGSGRPALPTVDFATDTAAALTVVRVGSGGAVNVYNSSSEPASVSVAVEGYVGDFPGPLRWSAARRIAPSTAVKQASCATPSFCMGIDSAGLPYVFNGQSWSRTSAVPSNAPLAEVSCGGTICAATQYGSNTPALFVYTHGGWTESSLTTAGHGVDSVQCVSSTFCAATARDDASSSSTVYLFNGTSWRSTVDPKMDPYVDPVLSCASATFCLGADSNGVIATFNGSVWTTTPPPPAFTRYDTDSISCVSAAFCQLLGDAEATEFTRHSWKATHTFTEVGGDDAMLGLTCASTSLCIALNPSNLLDDYVTGTWHAPVEIDAGGFVESISCAPRTSFCVALAGDGSYLTSH